ncbi:hypothetical protein LCGC14_1481480 [marine sediment metagenome]|uniref:Uncharacterized protein n=1 Tax=marine sediment metagenome TaxID=412755 RepID=A0A0F9J9F2_9ZZZZ
MSKIEEASNILEKIRGKEFVKNNPFTSEKEAQRFIETEKCFLLSLSEFEKY